MYTRIETKDAAKWFAVCTVSRKKKRSTLSRPLHALKIISLSFSLSEAALDCIDRSLRTRRNVEFTEDAANVVLDGLFAEKQLFRDLFI